MLWRSAYTCTARPHPSATQFGFSDYDRFKERQANLNKWANPSQAKEPASQPASQPSLTRTALSVETQVSPPHLLNLFQSNVFFLWFAALCTCGLVNTCDVHACQSSVFLFPRTRSANKDFTKEACNSLYGEYFMWALQPCPNVLKETTEVS